MIEAATLEARSLTCFKGYDVRGRVGRDLTTETAFRIGVGVADTLAPQSIVIGRDCRTSGAALSEAFALGAASRGTHVFDIGVAGTEEVYHAVSHLFADAGVAVTASHNPAHDNGMKFIGPGSRPLSGEEYRSLRKAAERANGSDRGSRQTGRVLGVNTRAAYSKKILSCADQAAIKPMTLVTNAGNGVAGSAFDAIARRLGKLNVIRLNHTADGSFPKGVPNPLLPNCRSETAAAVREYGAQLGVAWDGDFDRCFLFDEKGSFVDSAHLGALLASKLTLPRDSVVHDSRVIWPISEAITRMDGQPIMARTGHVHMKRAMRENGAIYGAEMSGHHYFREFNFCDTGMLPLLKTLEVMGRTGAALSDLVGEIAMAHPVSGEMNYRASNPSHVLACVAAKLSDGAVAVDQFDGLSLTFDDWRMNIRASATEPVTRLNIETRGDASLLQERRDAVDSFLTEVLDCERLY